MELKGKLGANFMFEEDKTLSLGLFRSDYMIHMDPHDVSAAPAMHQVEFNTIASSFGGLGTRVSQLHK